MFGGLVPWHPAAGGGQVIAYKLAQAISRTRHKLDYVVSAPRQLQRQVDWGNLIYVPKNARNKFLLSRILNSGGKSNCTTYDIIHVHADDDTLGYFLELVVRRLRTSGFRLALGIYTPQLYKFPRSINEIGWMCSSRAADRILALSYFSKRNISQAYKVPLSKVAVMYGGIDESFFMLREKKRKHFKLLFCGRLTGHLQGRRQQKGVDILLEAMPLILSHHKVKLEIVGSGPLEFAYRNMCRELGIEEQVEFSGFVEYIHMPDKYSNADLFILPSRRESFGLVLAEAMAAGLPVVSTQVGAIPEVVKDGETGILVPPENPEALATAVNKLLNNHQLMQEMGTKGRERVANHFTWDKVAERVLEIYQQML